MPTLILALLALAQTEEPRPKLPHVPMYGLNAGTYLPASAAVRTRFGGNWFSFSPGLGPVIPPPIPMLMSDTTLMTQAKQVGAFNNRAFMALLGAQYQWPLYSLKPVEGEKLRLPTFMPYAGVSLGGAYANLRSEADGLNTGSVAPYGSVYIGTAVGMGAFAEARWRSVGALHGLNLSGLELGVGLRF
ncbi:hypothetical protein [Armatimonas rosea]|uniref:Outer membrane protein beta-barrel domain-containing protein n=1 Tax=Armatimonas rosea TaxID=685828 RepID=A0A7W9SN07_ARMRO|nr:hypothetical protein [Armatimonas rosea]MBB6049625.1 hypothetical protein [Armatimonas rosea]